MLITPRLIQNYNIICVYYVYVTSRVSLKIRGGGQCLPCPNLGGTTAPLVPPPMILYDTRINKHDNQTCTELLQLQLAHWKLRSLAEVVCCESIRTVYYTYAVYMVHDKVCACASMYDQPQNACTYRYPRTLALQAFVENTHYILSMIISQ